ncbi:unnamed protein product [Effrenium voratum]|nr:unnamed protein product [Effrenium voratum]
MASVAAEAGVAAGAAVGFGLFNYNRANYLYDAEFRYERFSQGREYACEQQQQYRNDLRTLSGLTMVKNNQYAGLAALDMALCVALYCAGRLGLHGPSPPGWIMGLWLTNNAASFSFMGLAIFMALHASFRAQAASVNLLTRKIRVPVPSMRQLDKARRFSSEFEQQQWSDIFRVPYLTNPGVPKTDETSAKVAGSSHRARSASPGRRARASKASSWVREEFETDRAGTLTSGTVQPGALLPADAAPEHFRLYAAVQKEWFQYDIYARVCMLLGFSSFVQSLAFYGNGHIVVELRAFYVAHATAFTLEVLHVLLLRFDIIQGRVKSTDRTPAWFLWLGPVSVLFATVGMSLDFHVHFSIVVVIFTWICIFGAYVCQICYQLRILEVILPDDLRNPLKIEETIGDAWWPASWRCPSAFAHVLYFVAPPNRSQPGQFDIVREVKEGAQGNAFEQAGVPLMEARPVDTSEATANPGMSPEEIIAQVQYLDRLFDYFMSDQVFDALTDTNKQRVKDLFSEFSAARRKGTGPEAMRAFADCLMALEGITAAEGMKHEGEASTDAGYTSASAMSSASSGSEDEAAGEYSWDGRRLWKTEAAVRLFSKKGILEPWRLINILQTVICGTWCFLLLCMVVDVFLGDQALVTAPHWSRPPMSRLSLEPHELGTPLGFPWYAGAKPWIPEQMAWHEEKREATSGFISAPHSGSHEGGGGHSALHKGSARRLSVSPAQSALQDLLEWMPGVVEEKVRQVSWPAFFEPRVLACGLHGIAAVTPRGVGAFLGPRASKAQRFSLTGLAHLPPIISAAFRDSKELIVVTRAGHLATCPEARCRELQRLPLAPGAQLRAATAAWLGESQPELHAAFIDEELPNVVAIFKLLGKVWRPVGELPVPWADELRQPQAAKVSLALGPNELTIATGTGAVLRRSLEDGHVLEFGTHKWGGISPVAQWQGACPTEDGLAHLRLRRFTQAWLPELLVKEPAPRPAIFQ